MHPLMRIFYRVDPPAIDEHVDMFNQWERRVIDYVHGPQPRTIREILNELQMNTSTVYRIMERLTQRGVLRMTRIYIQNHGKQVKAFVVNEDAIRNANTKKTTKR